jgi:tetratricopeptide (TPR) repeat protein
MPNDLPQHRPNSDAPETADKARLIPHEQRRQAERLYRSLLQRSPKDFAALLGLGLITMENGRIEEAVKLFRKAVNQKPNSVEAHGNLGNALLALGRHDEAVERYKRALTLNPNLAGLHNNLMTAFFRLSRFEDAVAHGERAVALQPNYAEVHANLAYAMLALNRFDEAVLHGERALALKPANFHAHRNHGIALRALNRYSEAIAHYKAVPSTHPDFADAQFNASLSLLAMGDYEAGWKKYEWRWGCRQWSAEARAFSQPLWNGANHADGATILLHAEQGLGDTLQFARYAAMVAARGARVVLEVQPPLVRLLSCLEGISVCIARGETLPAFDCHCPLMSLPLAFGTRLETIPAKVPYLSAKRSDVARWRERLVLLTGLKVGLVWAGAPRPDQPFAHAVDRRRSISLEHFACLAGAVGVNFVSLQKGAAAAQARLPPAGLVIHDWTNELDDFAETAALIEALDIVISVDTSVVHLSGALGKPTWLLNRFDTCWRWLLGCDDSPWYPSLRQFRQRHPGQWSDVLDQVQRALEHMVSPGNIKIGPGG